MKRNVTNPVRYRQILLDSLERHYEWRDDLKARLARAEAVIAEREADIAELDLEIKRLESLPPGHNWLSGTLPQ